MIKCGHIIVGRPRHTVGKWWRAWTVPVGGGERKVLFLTESEAMEWYKDAKPPAEPFRVAGADGVYRC